MSFAYARAAITASRLITRFGQAATLRQTANSGTAYNPTRANTDAAVTVAMVEYGDRHIDGTLIKQGDRIAYLAVGTVPDVDHKLIVGGTTYSVVNVKQLNPAGTVVYYELQVRA
jgi:hypothetical protein